MQVTIRTALGRLGVAGALFMAASVPVRAQAPAGQGMDDQWHFVIAPYMWAAGIKGDLSVGNFIEVPVEASFSDIMENFDIGLLAHFEGRKNRWGFAFDLMYMKLSAPVASSAPVLGQLGINIDVRQVMTETLVFRRVSSGGSKGNPSHVDVIAGARYFATSAQLENDVLQTGEKRLNWVDALIGLRFRAPLGARVALLGRGDIAGFGSKFTWNLEGDLAFLLSEHWALGAGYRYLDIDYEKGEDRDREVFDVAFNGPRAWFSYAW